jgi:hypothetical protein
MHSGNYFAKMPDENVQVSGATAGLSQWCPGFWIMDTDSASKNANCRRAEGPAVYPAQGIALGNGISIYW